MSASRPLASSVRSYGASVMVDDGSHRADRICPATIAANREAARRRRSTKISCLSGRGDPAYGAWHACWTLSYVLECSVFSLANANAGLSAIMCNAISHFGSNA